VRIARIGTASADYLRASNQSSTLSLNAGQNLAVAYVGKEMEKIITGILILVGLINFYPAVFGTDDESSGAAIYLDW